LHPTTAVDGVGRSHCSKRGAASSAVHTRARDYSTVLPTECNDHTG